jgi:RimJ/RimL family protein N-acetyltransferase
MKLVDVYTDREKSMVFLYELIKERMTEPEVNISATMPTWQQHRQFVCRKPYRCWYLIEVDGAFVGYVSATANNEIGIVIAKASRGKGYGPMAIKELMRMHDPLPAIPSKRSGKWLANINPKNERSIGMFTSLGFKHLQNTYAL